MASAMYYPCVKSARASGFEPVMMSKVEAVDFLQDYLPRMWLSGAAMIMPVPLEEVKNGQVP